MIIEYIPFGRENAITRRRLCHLTGLKDRDVRGQIQKEAEKEPILIRSDGRGYYRPTLQDKEELRGYVKRESSRALSILRRLRQAKALLADMDSGRIEAVQNHD
jgi:hypothetical protein